jgi:hypothetical protein
VRARAALAAGVAAALAAHAASAWDLDRGDLRLELGGSLRSLGLLTREVREDTIVLDRQLTRSDSGLLLERLRLNAKAVWRDRVYAQVTYDNEARFGSSLDSLAFAVGDEIGFRTWFDADHTISSHDDGDWRHVLYRAFVRVEGEKGEVALGRQRIPLGRARLWNPIDLFNPIPPLAVEGDQRIGEDAVRGRLRLAPGLFAAGIWAPQDDPDLHRAAARLELSRTVADAALLVGRFGREWVVGADGAADAFGAAGRFEATFSDLEPAGRIWQVVGSLDYTFPVGSGLYALVEHFYNENLIDPDDFDRALLLIPPDQLVDTLADSQLRFLDRLTTIARNQTGVQAGYDLHPLLRADLLVIYDWNGGSAAFFPILTWSARADLVLSASVQLFVGSDRDTEYGDRPNLVFGSIDFYF